MTHTFAAMPPPLPSDPSAADARSEDQIAASLGIMRQMTEAYTVGEYRYTSLTDAIAAARRLGKAQKAGT